MSLLVRRRAWCALVLAAVLAGFGATAPAASAAQPSSGSSGEVTEASDPVPGQYIVTLRADKAARPPRSPTSTTATSSICTATACAASPWRCRGRTPSP
jgi:hypothetical protein